MGQPFGVELPDNLGSGAPAGGDTGGGAPDGAAPSGGAPDASQSLANQPNTQTPAKVELPDLDKFEKVRFKGREMTRKELEDGWLRQQDYTRKNQQVAERAKFVENFPHDLRTVIADRSKLQAFESIYPKEFVAHAKEILANLPASAVKPDAAATQQAEIPAEFKQKLSEMESTISEWRSEREQKEVEQNQKWLENQFDTLSKKYPNAHKEIVYARAEKWARADRANKVTPEVLDKIFKFNDAEMTKRAVELQKGKITQQLNAGKEGRDVGPGGDAAGGAPKKFKTIKDATAGFLADIAAGQRS